MKLPYFVRMGATLTISAKGQITLKKALLAHLGLKPGDKVRVAEKPGAALEVSPMPSGDISAVFGMLKRPGQGCVTIEEMNRVIAEGWAGKK